ncbi:hypothetical protein M885DRAFT_534569 [Pelagophyceae sp. CCMP2097]|nr:hypothetical protein M885DRAFT_534569 [Pelagophyceae sp. CCMP2097]
MLLSKLPQTLHQLVRTFPSAALDCSVAAGGTRPWCILEFENVEALLRIKARADAYVRWVKVGGAQPGTRGAESSATDTLSRGAARPRKKHGMVVLKAEDATSENLAKQPRFDPLKQLAATRRRLRRAFLEGVGAALARAKMCKHCISDVFAMTTYDVYGATADGSSLLDSFGARTLDSFGARTLQRMPLVPVHDAGLFENDQTQGPDAGLLGCPERQ